MGQCSAMDGMGVCPAKGRTDTWLLLMHVSCVTYAQHKAKAASKRQCVGSQEEHNYTWFNIYCKLLSSGLQPKGSYPKDVSHIPEVHILKFRALTLYRTELVSQNIQNIAKNYGIVIKGVSWPRMWCVELINTT